MALWPLATEVIAQPSEGNAGLSDVEVSAWAILVFILYAIYQYQCQASGATRPQHACWKETLESGRVVVANAPTHAQPTAAMQLRAKQARTADSSAKSNTVDPRAYEKHEASMLQKQFRLHASEHNMKGMLHTLEKLDGMPFNIPPSMYCTAIKRLAQQGEAVSAHRWLQRAVEVGHAPYNSTFHAVMNAYAKYGNMKSIVQVTELMKLTGVDLDTISYNVIINVFARIGDADNAQLWMERMVAANVQPSSVSFGYVFVACAKAGLMDALEEWFVSSQKQGVQCGRESLSPVVYILLEKGELDSAAKWLTRIIDSGAEPLTSFKPFFRCSLNEGNTDRVARVLEHMRVANMTLDSFCFSQLVIGAIRLGRLKQAQEWADECIAHKIDLSNEAQASMTEAGLELPVYAQGVAKRPGRASQAEKPAEAQERIEFDYQVLDTPKELEDKVKRTASLSKENMVFAHGWVDAPKNRVKDSVVLARGWQNAALREACTLQRHTGIIKDFIPLRFGMIVCKETFRTFGCDVHLTQSENPRCFAKGQRVEFSLRVDLSQYQLSAYDIKALRPSD